MPARILLHVQHLLGTGHLKRAAAIGAALATRHRVEIVSGGPPLAGLETGKARLVQLPPLRAADASFRSLVDEGGAPVDTAWKQRRAQLLLQAFHDLRPDVLITELFPFGRRNLEFELLPLLDAARTAAPRPLILCSLRDVLVAPREAAKVDRAIERARGYDRILVHGDPALIALEASYPDVMTLARRIVYTGYVAAPPSPEAPAGDGVDEVLVSSGGGAVGARLLETALAARSRLADSRRWRLLVGADLPADARSRLLAAAGPGLIVEPARADFPSLLRRCHVSLSQAGYNTTMDILEARARAVLVPFAAGGETEQPLRARALAAHGWAEVVSEEALDAPGLAAALTRAGAMARPDAATLRRAGASETLRIIDGLLAERAR
jgi:predicted glycosyltransferase